MPMPAVSELPSLPSNDALLGGIAGRRVGFPRFAGEASRPVNLTGGARLVGTGLFLFEVL